MLYYRTATKFGWTPEQTRACETELLDWMLAIDDVITEFRNKKANGK